MFQEEFRISKLIAGQLRNEISAAEQQELQNWIDLSEHNQQKYQCYFDEEQLRLKLGSYHQTDSESLYLRTLHKIRLNTNSAKPRLKIKRWLQVAAIAAAILLVGSPLAYYLYWLPQKNQQEAISYIKHDIPAGGNSAYITLSNGKTIQLSKAKSGIVINGDGLSYSDHTSINAADLSLSGAEELTITTPRGGQYQIILSDGTAVYLNAETSLKYPVAFAKGSRKVSLQGEAYFEVAKDKTKPFVVSTAQQQVTVLGTHFNISAYADESNTQTTLLEGAVRVRSVQTVAVNDVILSPGQQSELTANALVVGNADLEEAMAWKNGDFIFKEESLASIMRKVSRWYNVHVVFEEPATQNIRLGGMVSRSKNISAILKMMELTKRVRFKVEGRTITVLNVNN